MPFGAINYIIQLPVMTVAAEINDRYSGVSRFMFIISHNICFVDSLFKYLQKYLTMAPYTGHRVLPFLLACQKYGGATIPFMLFPSHTQYDILFFRNCLSLYANNFKILCLYCIFLVLAYHVYKNRLCVKLSLFTQSRFSSGTALTVPVWFRPVPGTDGQ